jgi:hypothetical protein
MRVALNSAAARRPLAATREFIRENGFAATADGIRRCRRAILDLPADHPARTVMESDDFFSCSGFRDLAMHACEHRYTLPQISDCLRELGLRFEGFECPPGLKTRFEAMFPLADALGDLGCWHRFEEQNPEAFRGMYRFYCSKPAV